MDTQESDKMKVAEEEHTTFPLIKHLARIVDATQDHQLSEQSLQLCNSNLHAVAERLSITTGQALLLAVFLDLSDDSSIRLKDIASHFGCHKVHLMCYANDLEELVHKRYIRQREINRKEIVYRMPTEVIQALQKNQMYTPSKLQRLTIYTFFKEVNTLFEEFFDDELILEDLYDSLRDLFDNNHHLPFVEKLLAYNLCLHYLVLFLYFCHRLVNQEDDCVMLYMVEKLYDSKGDFYTDKLELEEKDHLLMECNLIEEKKDGNMMNNNCYCLTKKAKSELLSEFNLNLQKKVSSKNMIFAKDITPKTLFYNPREQKQVEQLMTLLERGTLQNVQKRMEKMGMRKGFTCLLYGSPGTGKTETVYQLARQTGHDIWCVNVAEIKSMWVGESEKNIQELFDGYRNFMAQREEIPILLFNEADSIIGIRQKGTLYSADKMENSLQNIILQEMEKLEGVMIATTNLTQNLDPAFERRFLFKIEFDKPCVAVKEAIWHSMIPDLLPSSIKALAKAYDFSGGQIENISRKRLVDYIIRGRKPSLSQIHEYCKQELIHQTAPRQRIGFHR